MNNEEIIKQIAKNSRHIVEEADAQNITTEDEVEKIVIDLLSNPETLKEIKTEALSNAQETLYNMYHSRTDYNYREEVYKLMDPELKQIVEYGADYGPLNCLVLDNYYPDVKTAVKKGIIDNWGHAILDVAQEEYDHIHGEQEAV